MVLSLSLTYAPGYDDPTLGSATFEEVKSLRILGVNFHSMFWFETHLREVVLKAARRLDVVRWTGKLSDYPLSTYA